MVTRVLCILVSGFVHFGFWLENKNYTKLMLKTRHYLRTYLAQKWDIATMYKKYIHIHNYQQSMDHFRLSLTIEVNLYQVKTLQYVPPFVLLIIYMLCCVVYQVEMLCDLYTGFEPSQLSCLGSLVDKSVAWKADGHGFESHLRQPIFL